MEFLERENHFLELKDDGTYVRHFVRFEHAGGHQVRIDIDPTTKKEIATFIKVKNIIEIEKSTGKILSIKRDFNPQREILGAEAHPSALHENVVIEAVDYPDDMQNEMNGAVNYTYNKSTGKLTKKV